MGFGTACKTRRKLALLSFAGDKLGLMDAQNLKFATSQVLRKGPRAGAEAVITQPSGSRPLGRGPAAGECYSSCSPEDVLCFSFEPSYFTVLYLAKMIRSMYCSFCPRNPGARLLQFYRDYHSLDLNEVASKDDCGVHRLLGCPLALSIGHSK